MDAEFETELKSVLIGATRSQNLKFSKLRFWLLLVSIVTITLQSRWPLCKAGDHFADVTLPWLLQTSSQLTSSVTDGTQAFLGYNCKC